MIGIEIEIGIEIGIGIGIEIEIEMPRLTTHTGQRIVSSTGCVLWAPAPPPSLPDRGWGGGGGGEGGDGFW